VAKAQLEAGFVQLNWTNKDVTCVTTKRVTHGTLVQVAGMVSGHVEGTDADRADK
jgi:hypothetical protein